jgi:hypothetical protein
MIISEIQGGVLTLPNHRRACKILEYGKGEWWNSDKMLAHLDQAIDIAEELFPWARLIFRFDHSSNHTARGPDALNANNMNVGSGGKQNIMRDTEWVDKYNVAHQQSMVYTKGKLRGQPKGLRKVLTERGLLCDNDMPTARALQFLDPAGCSEKKEKLYRADMRKLLAAQPDFVNEKTLIHKMVEARGHICRFYPKFHCELPAIENYWCDHKRFCRCTCQYGIKGLRWVMRVGVEAVCQEAVRKYFANGRRWEATYRLQQERDKKAGSSTGSALTVSALVKLSGHRYKSHRRAAPTGPDGHSSQQPGLTEEEFQQLKREANCGCNECTGKPPNCDAALCPHHASWVKKRHGGDYSVAATSWWKKMTPAFRKRYTKKTRPRRTCPPKQKTFADSDSSGISTDEDWADDDSEPPAPESGGEEPPRASESGEEEPSSAGESEERSEAVLEEESEERSEVGLGEESDETEEESGSEGGNECSEGEKQGLRRAESGKRRAGRQLARAKKYPTPTKTPKRRKRASRRIPFKRCDKCQNRMSGCSCDM